jgi:hypothetical protein
VICSRSRLCVAMNCRRRLFVKEKTNRFVKDYHYQIHRGGGAVMIRSYYFKTDGSLWWKTQVRCICVDVFALRFLMCVTEQVRL